MIKRMSEEDIFDKVRRVILEILRNGGGKLDEDQIERDTNFIESPDIDSLDVVETAIALEEEFDLNFGDEEVEMWLTVKDIIRCVEEKQE